MSLKSASADAVAEFGRETDPLDNHRIQKHQISFSNVSHIAPTFVTDYIPWISARGDISGFPWSWRFGHDQSLLSQFFGWSSDPSRRRHFQYSTIHPTMEVLS
jgi:hypothetical protein